MDSWKLWTICFHQCLFHLVYVSNSPFFHLLLSLHRDSVSLCTALHLTINSFFFFSCSPPLFFAGARGLRSPPQSVFLSFPISPCRPQEHRRFCFKQSVRVGPTAWSTEPRWRSAKACSMRCTKLQVNNSCINHVNWASLFFHRRSCSPLKSHSRRKFHPHISAALKDTCTFVIATPDTDVKTTSAQDQRLLFPGVCLLWLSFATVSWGLFSCFHNAVVIGEQQL